MEVRNIRLLLSAIGLLTAQLMVAQQELCPSTETVSFSYIYKSDGGVDAYPQVYISDIQNDGKYIIVRDISGSTHTYDCGEASISEDAPELPTFTSFTFDNKHNDMLMVDAAGMIVNDTAVHATVGGIGKRLAATFQASDDSAVVYVNNARQISGESSQRFESPVIYAVSLPGYNILGPSEEGYSMHPFGREYVVRVDYLCDHPTTTYGVPIVRITTNDGQSITSKEYYKTATISIDGAGYYPDMSQTMMEIKGRGNSSWSGFDKKPYHIKFADKQKPLGMKAGRNWNLIAQAQTGSMTTNVIGSRISEMIGTDGANHFIPVELYLNGQYRGSYCLTEKVGLSNNSIEMEDESNAALLELDTYSYDFLTASQFNGSALPVTIHKPEWDDTTAVTNLTKENVTTSFNTVITALANGEDISQYVDIPSLARFLMLNDIILNYELMHPKSMYCYNENILADSLYHFGPTWDFDWGFGYEKNSSYFKGGAKENYYTAAPSSMKAKNFIYKLRFCGEEMNKQYYRVWTEFVNKHLADLCEYCNDYYAVAGNSLTHDNTKWYTGSNYQTVTSNSIKWLQQRAAWVYDYLSNTLGYADKGYLNQDQQPQSLEDIIASQPVMYGIYNMLGQRVGDDMESLPSGLYIVNGQKILKR